MLQGSSSGQSTLPSLLITKLQYHVDSKNLHRKNPLSNFAIWTTGGVTANTEANDGDPEFSSDHVASDSENKNKNENEPEGSNLDDEVVHTRVTVGRDNEWIDIGLPADEDMPLDSPLLHVSLTADSVVASQRSATALKRSAEPSTAEPDWDF